MVLFIDRFLICLYYFAMNSVLAILLLLFVGSIGKQYIVSINRIDKPLLSYLHQNTSVYKQVFNPSWIEPSAGTKNRSGLLVRTQDCPYKATCDFCAGPGKNASFLTVSEYSFETNKFSDIKTENISFAPQSDEDSWGTQDPRISYNKADNTYYMLYTAYNIEDTVLSLATTKDPFNREAWIRHGRVFPQTPKTKSGALLIRQTGPHYLFWGGDSVIRVAKSDNLLSWPDIGEIFLKPRPFNFDNFLVESGPPPLRLSDGNYIFFYNSVETGWPGDSAASVNPGWVILDGDDPTKIVQRSQKALMYPAYDFEKGLPPYSCNMPNVVFIEGAREIQPDLFLVYYGAADATVGHALVGIQVPKMSKSNIRKE